MAGAAVAGTEIPRRHAVGVGTGADATAGPRDTELSSSVSSVRRTALLSNTSANSANGSDPGAAARSRNGTGAPVPVSIGSAAPDALAPLRQPLVNADVKHGHAHTNADADAVADAVDATAATDAAGDLQSPLNGDAAAATDGRTPLLNSVLVVTPATDRSNGLALLSPNNTDRCTLSHKPACQRTPFGYSTLLLVLALVPLAETLLWLLIPLDGGMTDAQRRRGEANAWLVVCWYIVYAATTACSSFYANAYLVAVWERRSGPVTVCVFTAVLVGAYAIVWRVRSDSGNGFQVWIISALAACAFLNAAYRAYAQPQTTPAQAARRAEQLRSCIGLACATLVISALWVALQILSAAFASSSSLGENFVLLFGFGAGYVVAMQLLYVAERFFQPDRYWEAVTYFRFGASMLYYLYYRGLFVSVPSWTQFALYQTLHLVSECAPVVQYSDTWQRGVFRCLHWCLPARPTRHRLAVSPASDGVDGPADDEAAVAAAPLSCWERVVDALWTLLEPPGADGAHTTEAKRWRERLLRGLAVKEWVRSYTVVALASAITLIRAYRNSVYYPAWSFSRDTDTDTDTGADADAIANVAAGESAYRQFMAFSGAMLASELASSALITFAFYKLYGVHSFQRARFARLEAGFVWCVMWMALHTTNDVPMSLMVCTFGN